MSFAYNFGGIRMFPLC